MLDQWVGIVITKWAKLLFSYLILSFPQDLREMLEHRDSKAVTSPDSGALGPCGRSPELLLLTCWVIRASPLTSLTRSLFFYLNTKVK